MKSKIKIHEAILVIAALAIAIYVGKNIGIEYVLRGNEEPVSIAEAKEDHLGEYLGMPAGEDIPRINTLSEWEDIRTSTEYITIEPAEAIPTGIGSRSAGCPPNNAPPEAPGRPAQRNHEKGLGYLRRIYGVLHHPTAGWPSHIGADPHGGSAAHTVRPGGDPAARK